MIDLVAPANTYLRAFKLIPARPGFRPATVRHLLTHTSGIPEGPTQPVGGWYHLIAGSVIIIRSNSDPARPTGAITDPAINATRAEPTALAVRGGPVLGSTIGLWS